MVQMTMQLPEDLAVRIHLSSQWLPTILRLSLLGFRTVAVAAATELMEFLLQNPTPQEFMNYHASEPSQLRLRRLLALNADGLLSESEQKELDELQTLEHLVVRLKTQLLPPPQS